MLLLLLLPVLAHAATRQFNLDVHRINAAPDGYSRSVIGVNGQFPGPAIVVDKGDTMVIRVKNRLRQPTALHSHGLFQRGTNYYDGVAGITQCPIQPDDEMTYRIDTDRQAGTTWYHAHYKAEYVDGFYGPLIIRDPHDPHRHLYDEEMVITLSDFYHQDTSVLTKEYLSPASEGNEPIPDAGLINGKGRYNCRNAPPNSHCRDNAPRENFNFIPGKRYRLRIINTSGFAAFKFSIDGHKMTVIEADMVNLRPVTVDRLNINVAQRYSVVVVANQRPGNYWMRAVMSTACFPTAAPKLDRNVLARVHYRGASNADPTTRPMVSSPDAAKDCIDLDPSLLKPLEVRDVRQPSHIVPLDVTFDADSMGINRGHFNKISFVPNFGRSVLEDVINNQIRTFKPTDNIYKVPFGAEVRIILNNFDGGEHPFHLHGHEFQVLAWSEGVYDPKTAVLNTRNPLRRDTSTVPANGYTVLQFRADNLGFWMFHCHIEWHVLAGLAMTFQIGDRAQLQRNLRVPSDVSRMCHKARPLEAGRAAAEHAEIVAGAARARAQGFPKGNVPQGATPAIQGQRPMFEADEDDEPMEQAIHETEHVTGPPSSLAATQESMTEEYLT